MATRTSTQARVICYPKLAIPYRYNDGFIVADIIGDRMNLGAAGAGLSFAAINPTVSIPWLTSDKLQFESLDKVAFVRLLKDGTVVAGGSSDETAQTDLAGFILPGRIGPLDCKVYQGNTIADGGNFDLNWVPLSGKWRTALPPQAPRRNWIMNSGGEASAQIRTKGTIQANRQLCVNFVLSGMSSGDPQPTVAFTWGGKYRLVGRHGGKFEVNRLINGQWAEWATLEKGPVVNANGGQYRILLRRIAGRLVVDVNEHTFWFAETKTEISEPRRRLRSVEWPESPLLLECSNVVAMTSVQLIKYADAADVPFNGSFARGFAHSFPATNEMIILSRPAGWSAPGCGVTVTPSVAAGSIQYTCHLTSNQNGIDTPFVNKVVVRGKSLWRRNTTNTREIGSAVEKLTIDGTAPPEAAGGEANMVIDRNRLPDDWAEFLDEDCPIEISVREHYDDGVAGDWVPMFAGYVIKPDMDSGSYNERYLKVHALNPIWRLREKNAKVDFKYPPLDFIFMQQTLELDQMQVWGSDCVKELLNIALGEFAGDELNGDGNGEKYFSNHYPLLDSGSDTGGYLIMKSSLEGQPPSQNGWMFTPPFDSDVESWIKQIAEPDHAVFCYRKPPGSPNSFPVPTYGRLSLIMAGSPTYVFPDQRYDEGDQNKVITSVSIETKPDRAINAIQVWSNPPGGETGGLLPAVRMAKASLPASDRNAAHRSWEKQKIIKNDLFYGFGDAESVAIVGINILRDVDYIWPTFTTRGILRFQWGDKVQPKISGLYSDPDMAARLHGRLFRAGRVQHSFDYTPTAAGDDYTMTVWTRPLTTGGF